MKETKTLLPKISKEQFEKVVSETTSIAGFLASVGVKPSGYTYNYFHRYCEANQIDVSHYTGQGHLKGKSHNWTSTKIPLDDILLGHYPNYGRHGLKRRLITEKNWERRCNICLLEEWNNRPIPIQLDHINGISDDHRLENLRFVCPNCHAQTDNYCGKNIGNRSATEYRTRKITCNPVANVSKREERKPNKCETCSNDTTSKRFCSIACASIGNRKCTLTTEDLYRVLEENDFNYTRTAKLVGISDNGIRQRLKRAKMVP